MEGITALATANAAALVALVWHLEKTGVLNGDSYRGTLENTARSMDEVQPMMAALLRGIATQTTQAYVESSRGWVPHVIDGGLSPPPKT